MNKINIYLSIRRRRNNVLIISFFFLVLVLFDNNHYIINQTLNFNKVLPCPKNQLTLYVVDLIIDLKIKI